MQRRHEAPDMAAMASRVLRALAVRATEGDTEAIEALVSLEGAVREQLAGAVAGARARMDYSWADIAKLTGTTRQNAQQRWGDAVPPATWACEYGCGFLFGSPAALLRHYASGRCPGALLALG